MPQRHDDPFIATDADVRRATSWLKRHGGPTPPSRLVTARLAVRNFSQGLQVIAILACAVLIIGWALLAEVIDFSLEVGQADTNMRGPVEMAAFYLLLTGVTWWVARRQHRAEQRIAEALPRRATHSSRRGVMSVLGFWYLAAMLVTYPGGIAMAVAVGLTGDMANRALGGVIAVGTLAMGLIAATVIADAVQRPALAEDTASLAADDLLRSEDAHRVAPFPLFVALVAAVNTAGSTTVMWLLLGYVAVGMLLWVVAMLNDLRSTVDADSRAGSLGATK